MNYQKEMEAILEKLPNHKKTLLLHSCCAPCSSFVLEYLRAYFQITVFYYNPNISQREEYEKRVREQKRLIEELNLESEGKNVISFVEGRYEPERFFEAVKGLEACKEGGERCEKCFALRLSEAVKTALECHADYVTTTLTVSPLKNAELLNRIGKEEVKKQSQDSLQYLPSDFKKKNGYQRSVELSMEHKLYRQDYCGCVFSKAEREREKGIR